MTPEDEKGLEFTDPQAKEYTTLPSAEIVRQAVRDAQLLLEEVTWNLSTIAQLALAEKAASRLLDAVYWEPGDDKPRA